MTARTVETPARAEARRCGVVLWRERGESRFTARALAADLLRDAGMWRRSGDFDARVMWRRAFYGARNRRINAVASRTWSVIP